MWRIRPTTLDADTQHWALVDAHDRALSFEAVVRGWRGNAPFRAFWCTCLRDLEFGACCWECPPVTRGTASCDFECVFVSSPSLARMQQDPQAFAEHFRQHVNVVAFGNLGGDALLVAPCPGGQRADFSHLASFTATATAPQQDSLWHAVGQAMEKRLGTRPVWLSTAGLGVAWLHVRLDDRPKYYRHAPYAHA